jgi:hypothetical protein
MYNIFDMTGVFHREPSDRRGECRAAAAPRRRLRREHYSAGDRCDGTHGPARHRSENLMQLPIVELLMDNFI